MDMFEFKLQKAFVNIFPNDVQSSIVNLLLDAYDMRDETCEQCQLLKSTQIGQGLKAYILRAALEKVSKLYCDKGLLPWEFSVDRNIARNCKHIELSHGDSTVYFARVQNSEKKPRKVQYRQDLDINLFTEDIPEINTFLITYGEARISSKKFAAVGIPGEENWLYYKLLDLAGAEELRLDATKPVITSEEKNELLVDLIDEVNSDESKSDDWADENAE